MDETTDQATPIPIKTGNEVNPTWTAGAAAPIVPQAPPPVVEQPAGVVSPPSPIAELPATPPPAPAAPPPARPPLPQSQPSIPDPAVPPRTPPPVSPDLAIHPPAKPPRQFPWKVVGGSLAVLVILGGAGWYVYWQGIFLGAPRDPKVAFAKMATALAGVQGAHETGTFSVTLRTTAALAAPNNLTPAANSAPTVSSSPSVTASPLPATTPTASSASSTVSASPTTSVTALTSTAAPTPATTTPAATPSATTNSTAPVSSQIAPSSTSPIIIGGSFTVDQASKTNAKLAVQLDLSQLPANLLPATFPTAVNLETRLVGNTVYLQFPLLSLVSSVGSNQWIKLPVASSAATASLTQAIEWQKIAGAITSGQRIGYDQLGPVRAAHYQVSLDTSKLMTAFLPAPDASGGIPLLAAPLGADVWLGVRDMLPYKLQLHLGDSSKDPLAVVYTADVTQYNHVAPISAPDPSLINPAGLSGLNLADSEAAIQQGARDAQRKADLRRVKSALMLYKADHGSYPSTNGQTIKTSDGNSVLQDLVRKGYLAKLPVDPNEPTNWYGYKSSDGTTFELWAVLENKHDPDGQQQGAYYLFKLTNDPSAKDVQSNTTGSAGLPTPTVSPTAASSSTPPPPCSSSGNPSLPCP